MLNHLIIKQPCEFGIIFILNIKKPKLRKNKQLAPNQLSNS